MEKDNEHEGRDSGCDTAACYVREIKRLPQDPRPSYWKVYCLGEPLHEDHDKEDWAIEQCERLNSKLNKYLA